MFTLSEVEVLALVDNLIPFVALCIVGIMSGEDRNEGADITSGAETEQLCPRALYVRKALYARGAGVLSTGVSFNVSEDPAVQEIAKRVVAGVDRRFDLHPDYKQYVKDYGVEKAQQLIVGQVSSPGAVDLIQTDMDVGGLGLFGGLSEDGSKFVFHEWLSGTDGQMFTTMTGDEARAIVNGEQKVIKFYPAFKTSRQGLP